MSVRVDWTVTMFDLKNEPDPYTGLLTGPLLDMPTSWPMSREFDSLAEAQAFIDASPPTCSEWEITTEEQT